MVDFNNFSLQSQIPKDLQVSSELPTLPAPPKGNGGMPFGFLSSLMGGGANANSIGNRPIQRIDVRQPEIQRLVSMFAPMSPTPAPAPAPAPAQQQNPLALFLSSLFGGFRQ